MASQTRSVDSVVSSEWVDPANAFTENDLCTSTTGTGNQNVYNIINTPFTIPVGAFIDGIEVKVIRGGDADDYYSIELQDKTPAWKLKNGTAILAICAAGVQEALGGGADDWGGSWDVAHINSSSFQIRLTFIKAGKANTMTVDHIDVTVYYTPLIKLIATSEDNAVTSTSHQRKLVRLSDGTLYDVYNRLFGGQQQLFIKKSVDDGDTWTDETRISTYDGMENYQQHSASIAVDSNDYLHVIWRGKTAGFPLKYQIWYIKYTGSWGNIVRLSDYTGMGSGNQYAPSIIVDSSNNLHAAWAGFAATYSQIWYAKYDGSWSTPVCVNTGMENYHQFACSIGVDSSDYLHVAWYGQAAGYSDNQIWYSKYTDSWSAPVRISTGMENYDQAFPSIVIDPSDDVHTFWMGVTIDYEVDDYQLWYSKYTDSWSAPLRISTYEGMEDWRQADPAIAIDSLNYIHVFWFGKATGYTDWEKTWHSIYTDSWSTPECIHATGQKNRANVRWSFYYCNGGYLHHVFSWGYSSPYYIMFDRNTNYTMPEEEEGPEDYEQGVDEALTLTDIRWISSAYNRSHTETATLDGSDLLMEHTIRLPRSSLTLSDYSDYSLGILSQSIYQAIAMTETLFKILSGKLRLIESPAITDYISNSIKPLLADVLTLFSDVDSLLTQILIKTLVDAITIGEYLYRSMTSYLYESASLSDYYTQLYGMIQYLGMTIADYLNLSALLSILQPVNLGEYLTYVSTWYSALGEVVALSDYWKNIMSLLVEQSITLSTFLSNMVSIVTYNTLTLLDVITNSVSSRVDEALSLFSEPIAIWTAYNVMSESTTISDHWEYDIVQLLTKSLYDTLIFIESYFVGMSTNIYESLTLSDYRKSIASYIISEALTLLDFMTVSGSKLIYDAISTQDFPTYVSQWYRISTDALSLSDYLQNLPSLLMEQGLNLVDYIITDLISGILTQDLYDAIVIVDYLLKSTLMSTVETLTVFDADPILVWTITRALLEQATFPDYLDYIPTWIRSLYESTTLSDIFTLLNQLDIFQSLTVSSLPYYVSTWKRSIAESTYVSLSLSSIIGKSLSADISIVDYISILSQFLLIESVALADYITKSASVLYSEAITLLSYWSYSTTRLLTQDLFNAVSLLFYHTYGSQWKRYPADTISLAEYISQSATKPMVDTLSLADFRITRYLISRFQDITLSDFIAGLGIALTQYQSIDIQDFISRAWTATYAGFEAINVIDYWSHTAVIQRALLDFILLIEYTVYESVIKRFPVDTVMLTGVPSLAMSKYIIDSTTLLDYLFNTISPLIVETLTITDTLLQLPSMLLSQLLDISDYTSYESVSKRTYTDALTLSPFILNTMRKYLDIAFNITDYFYQLSSIVTTEILVLIEFPLINVGKRVSDIITLLDYVSTITSILKTLVDTLSVPDFLTWESDFYRRLMDPITLLDYIIAQLAGALSQSITQAIVLLDYLGRESAIKRILYDPITTNLFLAINVGKHLLDQFNISDYIANLSQPLMVETLLFTVTVTAGIEKVMMEAASLIDYWSYSISRLLPESITLSHYLDYKSTFERLLTVSLTTPDSLTLGISKYLETTLIVLDYVISLYHWILTITPQSIQITDVTTMGINQALTEIVSLLDYWSYQITGFLQQSLTDFITLTDYMKYISTFSRFSLVSFTVQELRVFNIGKYLPVDSVSLLDYMLKTNQSLMIDALQITDTITQSIGKAMLEVMSLIDYWSYQVSGFIYQSITNFITLSHFIDYESAFKRFPLQTVGISEAVLFSTSKYLPDTLTMVEYTLNTISPLLSEVLYITDYLSQIPSLLMIQSINLSHFLVYVSSFKRVPFQSITLSPSLMLSVAKYMDTVLSITDYLYKASALLSVNTLQIADFRKMKMATSVLDTITLIDVSIDIFRARVITVLQALSLQDFRVHYTQFVREMIEAPSLLDYISPILSPFMPPSVVKWLIRLKFIEGD